MLASHLWWQLPGPKRFVADIVQDLRDRKNVLVRLPEHTPIGLTAAIRQELGDEDPWHWRTVRLSEESEQAPLNLLREMFVSDALRGRVGSVKALSEQDSFRGHTIVLEDIQPSQWPSWKEFLLAYEHHCRSHSLSDRTVFCIFLCGTLAREALEEAVCLSDRRWWGQVARLDMTLYAWLLFQDLGLPQLQKELSVAITASLALWDPAVADRLSEAPFERILDPLPLLEELARERTWVSRPAEEIDAVWHRGMKDSVNGQERIHSAFLAGEHQMRELNRRIWNAEVTVMFPLVEEHRQEILDRFQGVLTVPFTTRTGEIVDDVYDLEIGHIEYQLLEKPWLFEPQLLKHVRRLREIRNYLSHLEPIPAKLILSFES